MKNIIRWAICDDADYICRNFQLDLSTYDNFKFEGGTFVALLKPGEEEAVLLQLVDGEYLESIEDEELHSWLS